jgi:hypothetical protein
MTTAAFDPKPRVVVRGAYTSTYTRRQMTESEKAEFSLLRWAQAHYEPGRNKKACHACGHQRDLFEANNYLLCAPCLLDGANGIKTVSDFSRTRNFNETRDGVRLVIVDGVIQQIGEMKS